MLRKPILSAAIMTCTFIALSSCMAQNRQGSRVLDETGTPITPTDPGDPNNPLPVDPTDPTNPGSEQTFADEAQAALKKNCASCHANGAAEGNLDNINDLAAVVTSGRVVAGNPAASIIIQRINDPEKPMPPVATPDGTALERPTPEELAAINNWVQAGARTPDTLTLATAARAVFEQHCGTCHGPTTTPPLGTIGYILDSTLLVEKKKVKPFNAKTSRVTIRMLNAMSPMPPKKDAAGNELPRLTEAEVKAVVDWINWGAPAFPM